VAPRNPTIPLRAVAAAAVATAAATGGLAACGFDADYSDTRLLCPPSSPRCPPGYTCAAGVCTTGADDGGPGDAGPDASVCELAMSQPDNDGCGAAIDLTAAALAAGGTIAYGDTTGYASDLTPSTLPDCTMSPEPGPDAIYRLTLAAGDSLAVTLSPDGWTGHVYVTDACTGTAACQGGAAAFSPLTVPITTAGTYYVVVDAPASGAAGCFALAATVTR
jgi:hypothetical protein